MSNWLDGCIQRVVVNSSISRWRLMTSGVPQRFAWGPVLCNIFISIIVSSSKGFLGKCADDTKLSSVVNMSEEQDAVQRDLDKLKKWAYVLVLAAASNKSTMRPPLPPPGCGGEWKETGRNW